MVDFKYVYSFNHVFGLDKKTRLTLGINNLFDETDAEYGEIDGRFHVPGAVAYLTEGRSRFIFLRCVF